MSDAVIVGIISATCTIIVQLIISRSKTRETNAVLAAHEQKQQDSIDEIKKEMIEVKKRLDSHNGYAEKFADAKKDIALTQKDVAITQRDVEYIKKKLEKVPVCRVE